VIARGFRDLGIGVRASVASPPRSRCSSGSPPAFPRSSLSGRFLRGSLLFTAGAFVGCAPRLAPASGIASGARRPAHGAGPRRSALLVGVGLFLDLGIVLHPRASL
jgi:hypothetical protein